MKPYLFALGREPLLSAAEIESFLAAEDLASEKAPERLARALRVSLPESFDWKQAIGRLGGTVRIARDWGTIPAASPDEKIAECLLDGFRQELPNLERKLVFGLSILSGPRERNSSWLKSFANGIKERLREDGIRARFVMPLKSPMLTGAQVDGNDLTAGGIEVLLLFTPEGIHVGRSLAVQDYEADAQRDMDKPDRRLREGLLPPKLARIMVNLARKPGVRTVLDPFCGSGVVLLEARSLGLEPIGTDVDAKAVESAQKNLAWLTGEGRKPGIIEKLDARNLSLRFAPLSIDAVATEPFLGPPLREKPERDAARATARKLRDLYQRALAEIRIVLKPGGRCVFVEPVFQTRQGIVDTGIERDFPLIGFVPEKSSLVPEMERGLMHRRKGQRVERRVWVLESGGG